MLKRFQIRHLLLLAVGLLAVITLLALGWSTWWTTTSLRKAQWIEQVNRVSAAVLDVSVHAGMERGLGVALLGTIDAPDEALRSELLRERGRVDSAQTALNDAAHALLGLGGRHLTQQALDVMQVRRRSLDEAREALDIALQGDAPTLTETSQIRVSTDYIDALAQIRRSAMMPMNEDDHADISNMLIKEIMFTAIEYAGRERALLTSAIASGESMPEQQLALLGRYRHVVEAALDKARATLAGFPRTEAIVAARHEVNDQFLGRYEIVRQSVYAASRDKTPYPLSSIEWFRSSTAAINTLVALSHAVDAHIHEDVRSSMARANRNQLMLLFFTVLALIVVVVAVGVIYRRGIGPLKTLAESAGVLAHGGLEQPVPILGNDEIGAVAQAMEQMRTTLLADMAERTAISENLRTSEQRFRNLVETTHDWFWEVDRDGRYTYASPQVEQMLGYAPQEVLGRTPFDFMPEEEAAMMREMFAAVAGQGQPMLALQNINHHRDGSLRILETSAVPFFGKDGTVAGYCGMDRDITERKQAEDALRSSERQFRGLLENVQLFAVMLDRQGNITFANDYLLEATGWTREELLGRNWFELYLPRDIGPELKRTFQRWIERGLIEPHRENPIQARDGQQHQVTWNNILRYGADGEVIGTASIGEDVTERRAAEAEAQKLLSVVEQTDDSVMITNAEGFIEYVNESFERVSGYRRDEVLGRHSRLLRSGRHDKEFYRAMWETLAAGQPFKALMTNRRKDGELYFEEKTIAPIRDERGTITHYASTGKDVTARRRAEEQLQQQEKLASLGQLAAGVAHEINNPVGYINSNISSLGQYMDDLFNLLERYEQAEAAIQDEAAREEIRTLRQKIDVGYLKEDIRSLVAESQEGVTRVRRIVQDLKDFSRVEEATWDWADLHKGLESTLNIVHNEIKYKADVIREYGELPPVQCVASQINQVFMNLLINAAHAIEEHGTITVRSGTEGDAWVWVEVEDSGKGMSAETLKRIFEPFFTTKPVGKGTGLGLSLSYGIVQRHGGRIEVGSEEGKGTRFRVWLPVNRPGDMADGSEEKIIA